MKILIYFIASLIMLSIDVQPLGFAIIYYLFALANVGYAVYLITVYRNSKILKKYILPYTMEEVRVAFIEALDIARLHGLSWKEHVVPKFDNKILSGYYILDETKSTTIKTIMI